MLKVSQYAPSGLRKNPITTSPYYVEIGTLRAMGSAATESKVLAVGDELTEVIIAVN